MAAPPWVGTTPTLTGRARHRPAWQDKCVLQVEEEWFMYQMPGVVIRDEQHRRTRWRDATWSDVACVLMIPFERQAP